MKNKILAYLIPCFFFLWISIGSAQNCLSFSLAGPSTTPQSGDTVDIAVVTQGFQNMVATQFSLAWNAEQFSFVEAVDYALPGINERSFGTPSDLETPGKLTFLWFSPQTTGQSLADNTSLFVLRFRIESDQDATALLEFANAPASLEFIDGNDQVISAFLNGVSLGLNDSAGEASGLTFSCPTSNGCSLLISGQSNGGTAPFSYQWTGPGSFTSTTPNAEVSKQGLYELTQTDATGRITKGAFWLAKERGVSLTIGSNYECTVYQDSTVIDVNLIVWEGGQPPYSFNWNNGKSTQAEQQTSIRVNQAGQYWATITDANGCSHVSNPISVDCTFPRDTSSTSYDADIILSAPKRQIDTSEMVIEIPLTIHNFHQIGAAQFSFEWDPGLLQLDSVILHPNLENMADIGTVEDHVEGKLRFLYLSFNSVPTYISDNDPVLSLFFKSTGQPGFSSLRFSNALLPIECWDFEGNALQVISDDGYLIIGENLIWPGDTDTSGLVNHFDLLNIGLAYGQAGPARPESNLLWRPQYGLDWEGITPESGINFKHIDTNGDGLINFSDTTALYQNWGKIWSLPQQDPPAIPKNQGPALFVRKDTLGPGGSPEMAIMLGTPEVPANNVYGLAFTLQYDSNRLNGQDLILDFQQSWLGIPGTDLLAAYRNYPKEGKLEIGITRTDGQNISGNGPIIRMHVTLEDVIFRSSEQELYFEIEDVRLINAQETDLAVSPKSTTSLISDTVSKLEWFDPTHLLELFPLPAQEKLFIKVENLTIETVEIFRLSGEKIGQFKQAEINLSQWGDGLYLARIFTDKGVVSKKIYHSPMKSLFYPSFIRILKYPKGNFQIRTCSNNNESKSKNNHEIHTTGFYTVLSKYRCFANSGPICTRCNDQRKNHRSGSAGDTQPTDPLVQ